MEDNLNQNLKEWKTTSIFLKKEDFLNFFENGRRPQFCLMEDKLNIIVIRRQSQMEDDLNNLFDGRRPLKITAPGN